MCLRETGNGFFAMAMMFKFKYYAPRSSRGIKCEITRNDDSAKKFFALSAYRFDVRTVLIRLKNVINFFFFFEKDPVRLGVKSHYAPVQSGSDHNDIVNHERA